MPSCLPLSCIPYPPDHIHQSQQHGHLNQRPHRRRKRLITISPIRRRRNRNRQLKIVACSRKALCCCQLVSKTQFMCYPQRNTEDGEKVDDEGGCYANHRNDLVHDAMALGCEENDDGVEESDERPWCYPFYEGVIVPCSRDLADGKAGYDGRG